jgi:hypothetical protein
VAWHATESELPPKEAAGAEREATRIATAPQGEVAEVIIARALKNGNATIEIRLM